MSWDKARPQTSSENLSVLLWNCEGLSMHLSDFHFLLTSHCPLIFILTGVGKQIRALQPVPNYKWFSQEGSNSFGGVAILVHQFEMLKQKLFIAGVYIPSNTTPPFDIIVVNRLNEWLEENGLEIIHSNCQTSKKSNSVIDFCIGKHKENWSVERLDEGNSDHYPVLFFSVIVQWKKFAAKRSLDSLDNSAFLMKQLPYEYLNTITILFNKCAEAGDFFEKEKVGKGIFLSKDGAYPTENRLRSISLLPKLSKVFERVIAVRIEKWCSDYGIHLDEQSGFTSQMRLQTRILAIIEDLRLTVAACNRPALAIFIDFATAFDKMWWLAPMRTLERIEMPLELRRFIFNWLQNRKMCVSHGDAKSRFFSVLVGASQGSVLTSLLFRLHIQFLPSYFLQIMCHLFADDLTIIIKGALEMRLSANIKYLESQAKGVLNALEKFSDDRIK